MTTSTGSTYRLEVEIGVGSFGFVFKAEDISTGRVVALKKSRTSLKVQRTILQHEARVLALVAGHPSIPTAFAYGRFEHFEYLALELLDECLGSIVPAQKARLSLKSVSHIADQLLSALEHIHKHRIIHRDIKPNNVMVNEDFSVIHLIDFGIARPCPVGEPKTLDIFSERSNVIGTLRWASINAHRGIDLGPRDDLESLAYTLLFVLRGELPWQDHCFRGTIFGRYAHIREKKRAWTGSRLAEGHHPAFGQLLDYARGLEFHETIDYGRFRAQLQDLQKMANHDDTDVEALTESAMSPNHKATNKCPVEVGQLILVQIVSRTSIEGYSMEANDQSYWHDPALSSEEWRTSARPAIVIGFQLDLSTSLYKIHVVSLGHGPPVDEILTVPVSISPLSLDDAGTAIVPEPAWPKADTYCYAFPRATWFYCLPNQTISPAHWMIDAKDVRILEEQLAVPPDFLHWAETKDDADVRYDMRMKEIDFYVHVATLGPSDLKSRDGDDPIEWSGGRGWFDERVKIARRRVWDNGRNWTTSSDDTDSRGIEISDVMDSYNEWDRSLWEARQRERDQSLTLDQDQQQIASGKLADIAEVV